MEYKRVNGGDTYLILQSPASGQSSAEISKVCANEDTAIFALTSSLSGMTVTIRGAPSTPLNIRVAEMIAFRLTSCVCFA